MPTFQIIEQPDKSKLVYVDLAGLQDTKGDFFDIINVFVIKRLFMSAKTVKLILPITNTALFQSRGMMVR